MVTKLAEKQQSSPSAGGKSATKWIMTLLSSSIGQKFVMGITGLLLCGFLVVHLAGNLLVYVGADAYNKYAKELHSMMLLPVAETGLFLLLFAHIALAFKLTSDNRKARQITYHEKQSKIQEPPSIFGRTPMGRTSSWMFISGSIILIFLIMHMIDMKLHLNPTVDYKDQSPFGIIVQVLGSGLSAPIYIVGTLVLGFHLSHGFWSAFQSLGLNHPKYTPLIKKLAILFAIVIAAGFVSLPLWGFFIR
ncbi:MAG: succinate dehydrogenase cytochrome b subunit [bacterium]|jgi:succinate dehydrogenase / fumarate reductase cytochrome b subunit|uniref:Succinate dehydrogenase/Fumarate reductase transmembrane subunit n=1 Tax=Gimesia chilikensis TaxID=2605989 RepID=A0A517W8D4_9PLAN|nr:succinate dehydrogenase cytochrome b subunit [Gimesia chilikensis]MCR9232880.1 succinate dehydrogenase cytochrome b subunit [bacterium]QDU01515.1 Succinate dehydrogenase/Fumarate reductase transmembrane subunit [Gimesia chilikensis]